jgi:hypothetical protein
MEKQNKKNQDWRDRLRQHEFDFSAEAWNKMEEAMEAGVPPAPVKGSSGLRKRLYFRFLPFGLVTLSFLIAGLLWWNASLRESDSLAGNEGFSVEEERLAEKQEMERREATAIKEGTQPAIKGGTLAADEQRNQNRIRKDTGESETMDREKLSPGKLDRNEKPGDLSFSLDVSSKPPLDTKEEGFRDAGEEAGSLVLTEAEEKMLIESGSFEVDDPGIEGEGESPGSVEAFSSKSSLSLLDQKAFFLEDGSRGLEEAGKPEFPLPVKRSRWAFGLKAGLDSRGTSNTWLAGLGVEYRLSEKWLIAAEVHYKKWNYVPYKSFFIDTTASPSGPIIETYYESVEEMWFWEFPLLLQYESGKRFRLQAGAYGSLVYHQAFREVSIGSSIGNALSGGSSLSPGIRNTDFGLLLGGRVYLTQKLAVEARYVQGLTDLTSKDWFKRPKDDLNSSLQVSLRLFL